MAMTAPAIMVKTATTQRPGRQSQVTPPHATVNTGSSAMRAASVAAFDGLVAAAAAMADSDTEPEKPYSIATPNRKNAEENAPSRKYFIAASCDSSRRRRASAPSRYSGRD